MTTFFPADSPSQRHPRALAALVVVLGVLGIGAALGLQQVAADPSSGVGKLTVDDSGHWFAYEGNGEPYFMAGSGGPEGFLYYSDSRKQSIVDQLIRNDVRAIYIHAARSNGGDGGGDENPFIGNNPDNGVDPAVLDEWDTYLSQLDEAGIVTWFHLYDDGARPFGACNPNLPSDEKQFIKTVVERFRHYQHLVWLPTEEHIIKGCSNNSTDVLKAKAIAAEIRRYDDVHPLGVHHNNGQSNQYLGNTDIDVFSQQVCQQSKYTSVDGLHTAGEFGEDVYVMAECHPWHKDLLDDGERTTLRRSFWASVMAGGYVLFYDAWESTDPTEAMLADLGRINAFMDTTRFAETEPADQLAAAGTKWVLGNTTADVYIAYSNENPSAMGIQGLSAGTYDLGWFDPMSGQSVSQTVTVGDGTATFLVPAQIGDEVALSVEPAGDGPTTTLPPTTAPSTTTPPTSPAPTTAPPTTPTTAPSPTAPPTTGPGTTLPGGTTITIEADEDAYLQNSKPFNNSQIRLEHGGRTRVGYLRFDTSGIENAAAVGLAVNVGSDPGAGTISVLLGTGGSWTESSLNSANAPTGGDLLATTSGLFSKGEPLTFDLPAGVVSDDFLDLVITHTGSGVNDVSLSATEDGDGDDGPTLVVTTAGTNPPGAPPVTEPPANDPTTPQPPAPDPPTPTTPVTEPQNTRPPATTAPTTPPTAPPPPPKPPASTTPVTEPPVTGPPNDAGTKTVTFSGSNAVIANPERGFHKGASVVDSTGGSNTSASQLASHRRNGITLVRMYIRLDDYRNVPVPNSLLTNLDTLFGNVREAGIKIIPRFSYNFGSAPDASMDRIEKHIAQVTPVIQQNSDVIAVMQAGFIGAWGEWHSSSNGLTNPGDRARVRAALFEALPADRMVQFRYPDDVMEFEPNAMGEGDAFTGSSMSRTAHKNDCFLANEHDAGTYIPLSRKGEFYDYLSTMTEFTVMGGETCQVSAGSQRTDCATAISELELFHWDYLNLDFYGNTIDRWRNDGCFDEINNRLGYRFEMRSATASEQAAPGGRLDVRLRVANEGFGKLYNPRPLNLVLVNDATGAVSRIRRITDARTAVPLPGDAATIDLSVNLPSGLAAGTYSIHVELPDGADSLADDPRYSIRMANNGTWRDGLGTNDLGLDVDMRRS
ncbi:MAG: DUF4832 domain-containing protein [Actinomycetota bacterium]